MNDVARVTGVSSASVSYALTGAPGVSDELRERIRTIANELGHRPSLVAQSLKTGRARSIGPRGWPRWRVRTSTGTPAG